MIASFEYAIAREGATTAVYYTIGLTFLLIFLLPMVLTRNEADILTPLTFVTGTLLLMAELGLNFMWTLYWSGSPGNVLLLLSVFLPVGVIGARMLTKWHVMGVGSSVSVMTIYVVLKAAFAIFVSVEFIDDMGSPYRRPNLISVWMKGDDWKVRQNHRLHLETPAQLVNVTMKKRNDFSHAGSAKYVQAIDWGGYSILVLEMKKRKGAEEFHVDEFAEQTAERARERDEVTDLSYDLSTSEVSGLPAGEISMNFLQEGKQYATRSLVFAGGETIWVVEVAGNPSHVEKISARVLGSVALVDPASAIATPDSEMEPDRELTPEEEVAQQERRKLSYLKSEPGDMREIDVAWAVEITPPVKPYPLRMELRHSYKRTGPARISTFDVLGRTEASLIIHYPFDFKSKGIKKYAIENLIQEQQGYFGSLPVTHRDQSPELAVAQKETSAILRMKTRRERYVNPGPGEEHEIKMKDTYAIVNPIPEPYPVFMLLRSVHQYRVDEKLVEYDILGRTEEKVIVYSRHRKKQEAISFDIFLDVQQEYLLGLPVTHASDKDPESKMPAVSVSESPAPAASDTSVPLASAKTFPQKRVLTGAKGRKLDVTITGRSEDTVVFINAEGEEFRYPIDKLSAEDQEFLRKLPVSGD